MKQFFLLLVLLPCALSVQAEEPIPDEPEYGITVRYNALNDRAVTVSGKPQSVRVEVSTVDDKDTVTVEIREGSTLLRAELSNIKNVHIQNVALDGVAPEDGGRKFRDSFGHSYELTEGPPLPAKANRLLRGSTTWDSKEIVFVEPSVKNRGVLRAWKRIK